MGAARGTILAATAMQLIMIGGSRGLDIPTLVGLAGAPQEKLGDPDEYVPIEKHFGLLEHIARALDAPALPMWVAAATTIEQLQLLGFLVMSAADGRECFRRLMRYSKVFTNSGRWSLEENGDMANVWWDRPGDLTLGHRLSNEIALGACLVTQRQLLRNDYSPRVVTFRHAAPRDLAAHREVFRAPLHFGAPRDGFSFPAALLDVSPRSANPALHEYFVRQAEALIPRLEFTAKAAARVRDAVSRELVGAVPTAARIAQRLAMSERTLRRYLDAEGTSFRAIVDEVRIERAEQLLRDRRTSMAEIAHLLGYSDVRAFNRAFKRCVGATPADYRSRGERGAAW